MTINGYEGSFWGDGNVIKLYVVLLAQLCKFSKNYCFSLKMSKLYRMQVYFNKALLKRE